MTEALACKVFSIFQNKQWSFVATTQGKVWEKSLDWADGCTCGPEVEVYIYAKWVGFGLLNSDLQKLWIVPAVYGDIIDRQVTVLVIPGVWGVVNSLTHRNPKKARQQAAQIKMLL